MLIQQDVVEQRAHADAVAVGGWSLDLHPSDAVYSNDSPCNQWHSKGVYGIPYRCYYSRNISNLFLAGRIISASHVAFGSTRVMLTCAHGANRRRHGGGSLLARWTANRASLTEPTSHGRAPERRSIVVGQAIPRCPAERGRRSGAGSKNFGSHQPCT